MKQTKRPPEETAEKKVSFFLIKKSLKKPQYAINLIKTEGLHHTWDIYNCRNTPLKSIFLDEDIQTDLYDNFIVVCYKGVQYK